MTSVNPPEFYFPGIQYNPAFFSSSTNYVTLDYAQANYLGRQGAPTSIASDTSFSGDISISGQTIFSDTIQLDDGTIQSSAYTGAGALAGSYVTTNMTINNQGKITAISSGNPIPATIVVSAVNDANTYYPTFTNTDGSSQALLVDDTTTPMSYIPSTGTLTISNLNTGNSRVNTSLILPDGTTQTSAYTGASTLAGSYTNTNVTINNQGKITAITNGTGGGGGGTNAISADISTTDTGSILYPVLAGVGSTQTLYCDNITTPLSYVPLTGTLSCSSIVSTLTGNITGNAPTSTTA